MIREATEGDILALVELGKRFYNSTILKDIVEYDAESTGMTILSHIENKMSLVLVYEHEGEVVGGFMGTIVPLYWNFSCLCAQQMSWFVDPGKRGSGSVELFESWERWAYAKGARFFAGGAKKDHRFKIMDRMLRCRGYVELESMHIKGVN